jgi:hypothetical protein
MSAKSPKRVIEQLAFSNVLDSCWADCAQIVMPPTEQEPSVDWSNPQDIHTSISVAYGISEKHDTVNGVHVTYDIDTVISRECDFGNSVPATS